eukprot:16312539-Heterocapsa_arctica.AAC.1
MAGNGHHSSLTTPAMPAYSSCGWIGAPETSMMRAIVWQPWSPRSPRIISTATPGWRLPTTQASTLGESVPPYAPQVLVSWSDFPYCMRRLAQPAFGD